MQTKHIIMAVLILALSVLVAPTAQAQRALPDRDELWVKDFYIEALEMVDIALHELNVMHEEKVRFVAERNTFGLSDPLEPPTDVYKLKEIQAIRDSLEEQRKLIHSILDWRNQLPIRLVDTMEDFSAEYMAAYRDHARFDVYARLNEERALHCKTVVERTEVLDPFNQATLKPHFETHLRNQRSMIARYHAAGKDVERRRGELGKYLWRIHRLLDVRDKTVLKDKTHDILKTYVRIPRFDGGNPFYWLFHDTHFAPTFLHGRCSIFTKPKGQLSGFIVIPSAETARYIDVVVTPYHSFNESTEIVPPPPEQSDVYLERVAQTLTHRMIQQARLEQAITTQTETLFRANQTAALIAADRQKLSAIPAQFAEMSQTYGDLETQADTLEALAEARDRAAENAEIAEADYNALVERSQQKNESNNAIRLIEVADGYRLADEGKTGRTREYLISGQNLVLVQLRPTLYGDPDQNIPSLTDRISDILAQAERAKDEALKDLLAETKRLMAWRVELTGQIKEAERRIAEIDRVAEVQTVPQDEIDSARKRMADAKRQARLALTAHGDFAMGRDRRERVSAFEGELRTLTNSSLTILRDIRTRHTPQAIGPSLKGTSAEKNQQRVAHTKLVSDIDALDQSLLRTLPDPDAPFENVENWSAALANISEQLETFHGRALSELRGEIAQRSSLERRKASVDRMVLSIQRSAIRAVQRKMPDRNAPNQDATLRFLDTYSKALDKVASRLKTHKKDLAQIQTYSGYADTFMSYTGLSLDKNSSVYKKLIDTNVKNYLNTLSAVETAKGKVEYAGKVVTLVNDLTSTEPRSPEQMFDYLEKSLGVTEAAFNKVPVLGTVGSMYFGFLKSSVKSIGESAKGIHTGRFDLVLRGKATPEQHLYTQADLNSDALAGLVGVDSVSTRDKLVPLQIRRIMFVLGANTPTQLCNKAILRNEGRSSYCDSQGRIE